MQGSLRGYGFNCNCHDTEHYRYAIGCGAGDGLQDVVSGARRELPFSLLHFSSNRRQISWQAPATWSDPQHAFSIRVGKRLYALRTVQGDVMHLVTDPRSFAAHRLNPITTRPLLEAITGRDEFGRPQDLQEQMKDVAKGIMPIPLQALTRPGDSDIRESAAKGMGFTAYRYRSRAARTAHELITKGGTFGELTRTPAEQKLMAKHRAAIEAGKFGVNAVRSEYKAGQLREPDAKLLVSESKTPQLERDFRRLSLERALEVWELASDEERKQLRPILLKKKSQLENRVPAERAKLEQKLRAALSEKKAPSPGIPGVLRKLLTGKVAADTH